MPPHSPLMCGVGPTLLASSVWIAGGDYMGERIESKGSSPSFALAHWQEAARYKGN
jgi:hypothetical protein